ncbi:MAG: CaiB/BaiF CoA transferase family protein [Dehalococcoidia bacterium]
MNGKPPLVGIRVIDLATPRAELAGRLLADLGAEVIKVEPPGGTAARAYPPFDRAHPGESLYWASVALGKKSVVLDLETADGRGQLLDLAATADILIESFEPGFMDAVGLGYTVLEAANPRLVYVSVSPYGQSGPFAHDPSSELTIEAAGGLLGLQGDGDRPPVPVGYPQSAFHAGAQAAADALVAIHERIASGRGQRLDVSAQAAMVWTLMNATGYPPNHGGDPPGHGEQRADPPVQMFPGLVVPRMLPCKDGWITYTISLAGIGPRTHAAIMEWAEELGLVPEGLRGLPWGNWIAEIQAGNLSVGDMAASLGVAQQLFETQTKLELQVFANRTGILVAPIYSISDLLDDPQLAARHYWSDVGGRTHPGPFARLSATPVEHTAAAPALGEHQPLLDSVPRRTAPAAAPAVTRRGAFDGIKIADFAWVGVGPLISKGLADHGATVVHMESLARPDILRLAPPYKDGVAGIDRAQFMANFNSSKLGLACNLQTEAGRELAWRVVEWADVVVESFTPGTLKRWGLDYEAIRQRRPDIVMLSTCLRGQTGPEAGYTGFGGQGAALAGIHSITGWPDRAPSGPWGAYTDFINPRYGVAALTAALIHRQRTGEGQYIDLAQSEAGIHFIEPLVLDYIVNGREALAAGHDSLYACPHGTFRTAGVERYVAIAVETAAQWESLKSLAGLSAFAGGAYATVEQRIPHKQAIEDELRAWCLPQEPFELAGRLRSAGVPASVVLRPSDLYNDPQLMHRGFFVTLDHPVMGPTPYDGPATQFSETPAVLSRPGPCLGEHTMEVLSEILGLSDDEIADYAAAGALQ